MKISVITINYNNAAGLERTIKSTIAQRNRNFEYVIVDGGSSDGSKEIIEKYASLFPIKYISERDNGLYNAMNKGIDLSTGEYCIFMNSGDEFYDDMVIENILPYIKDNIGVISGIGRTETSIWYPVEKENLNLTFFLKNSLNHQSTFVRRNLLEKYHFSEQYRIVSDTEFLFKVLIIDNETYENVSVVVCKCENPGTSGDLRKSLKERYYAIKKILPPRMNYDIDFIVKYHNPTVLFLGRILYNTFFRKISQKLKNKRVRR